MLVHDVFQRRCSLSDIFGRTYRGNHCYAVCSGINHLADGRGIHSSDSDSRVNGQGHGLSQTFQAEWLSRIGLRRGSVYRRDADIVYVESVRGLNIFKALYGQTDDLFRPHQPPCILIGHVALADMHSVCIHG